MRQVFVTGGTGYIGRRVIAALIARGHRVHALARPGSETKLPPGCTPFIGDALEADSYRDAVAPADTFVHLVGVAHPSPAKAAAFRSVDLASARAAVQAARAAGTIRHFVYLSVAQPAPVMKAYVAARREGEAALAASGLPSTVVRPWYVLGPGHWWPLLLLPLYAVARLFPRARATARRLGLVTLPQMVSTLVRAVESPAPTATRVIEVPEISSGGGARSATSRPGGRPSRPASDQRRAGGG
ncbi:MAG TPA: NAD(P)H-binding protein [Polyangia bacterium]|nr:NAD(P)H-binding protein [Polyangia bacterium]